MYTLLSCAMWCYNNCTFHPNCIWYDEQCAWWIVFMIQGQGPPNCCSILLSPLWICDMVSSTEAAWKTWRPIQSLVFYLLFAKLWPIWNALNILVFLSPCDCPPSRHTLQHFVAFLAMMSEEHSTSWPCVQRMQALTRHPPSWMIAKPRCKQTQVLSSGRSNPSRLSSLIIRILNYHTLLEHEPLLRQNVVLVMKPHVCPKIHSLKIDPGVKVEFRAYLWATLPNVIGEDVHGHVKSIGGLSWNATCITINMFL